MATGRVFTANVVLTKSSGAEARQFKIGEEVPQWALDKVGDHASQGVTRSSEAPAPSETPVDTGAPTEIVSEPAEDLEEDLDSYLNWTKAELKDEAKGRAIEGFSKMSKEELAAALDADDAENAGE